MEIISQPMEINGCEPVGPSAIIHPNAGKGSLLAPRELTKKEIEEIVSGFAQAARRVKAAGADGVEIHSAHGCLLNQFYFPLTNKRQDEYGADTMENRTRFHAEVIHAVREMVGDRYPVSIRLGAAITGMAEVRRKPARALRRREWIFWVFIPGHTEPGYFKGMSKAVKIPVLLTGGVKKLGEAQELLEAGEADLIGVGRAIFKDARWADKEDGKN